MTKTTKILLAVLAVVAVGVSGSLVYDGFVIQKAQKEESFWVNVRSDSLRVASKIELFDITGPEVPELLGKYPKANSEYIQLKFIGWMNSADLNVGAKVRILCNTFNLDFIDQEIFLAWYDELNKTEGLSKLNRMQQYNLVLAYQTAKYQRNNPRPPRPATWTSELRMPAKYLPQS